jgi:DNA polymerase (family 10)
LQVDFRIVEPESEAAALQHFTGSKEHNTILRSRAKTMGLKMNEYGVFRGEERLPLADEAAVYGSLGLAWIPPELREGEEEVESASGGKLPTLVEEGQIRGMIHVHSNYSDGLVSIEEMARACRKLGYDYLCLSDHSRSAGYAGGLSAARLEEQMAEVAGVNEKLAPFRIFCGIESDILGDGRLDYPEDVLTQLDFVIGSVHSNLTMSREAATERLLRAVNNPYLTILGHPSGALLLSRAGYEYDEQRLFAALEENDVVLEHNCNPHRLDPDWPALKRAARRGIRIALCPDAHSPADLVYMRFGVLMARKAWLSAEQILNCMSMEEIDGFFSARKS